MAPKSTDPSKRGHALRHAHTPHTPGLQLRIFYLDAHGNQQVATMTSTATQQQLGATEATAFRRKLAECFTAQGWQVLSVHLEWVQPMWLPSDSEFGDTERDELQVAMGSVLAFPDRRRGVERRQAGEAQGGGDAGSRHPETHGAQARQLDIEF